jgi:hypothetical protein
MDGASAWELLTKELISRIDHEIEETQVETTRRIATLKMKRAALEESILTYREMMHITDKPASQVLTAEDVRDKSQKQILVLIALRHNGLLVANQAVKQMSEAGVFGNPENASSSVYSVLKRSPEFERVGKGIYKLRA